MTHEHEQGFAKAVGSGYKCCLASAGNHAVHFMCNCMHVNDICFAGTWGYLYIVFSAI